MNWFIIYWDMVINTGFFGLLLVIITLIGLFSVAIPFISIFSKKVNPKSLTILIKLSISLGIFVAVSLTVFNGIELPSKFNAVLTLSYFILGLIPFLILPLIMLPYHKWFNKNYMKVK